MLDRMPPLNALRVFESVARHNSLKLAAAELFVTPAAVSHQVKLLEDFVGHKLLQRGNRSIELTPMARQALPKLTEAFSLLSDGAQLLSKLEISNALVISTPPSFAACWLMPRLHRFMQHHPEIEVRVSARSRNFLNGNARASNPGILGAVKNEEIDAWLADSDVAIFLNDGPLIGNSSTTLMQLTMAILASPRYVETRLKRGPNASLDRAALAGQTLIHDDMGITFDGVDLWDRMLAAPHLSDVPHLQGPRFSHSVLALEAASDDLGLIATAVQLAERELRDGRLLRPFADEVTLPFSYQLVYKPARLSHAPLRAFNEWVVKEAQSSL
jgi:LysR family transcriptional regulator, glycine cleavage system transcriptional activator